MKGKRGLVWSEISWWVIAIVLLAMVVIAIILLHAKGTNLIEEIKNFLRFGR
ncbi:MAG: hypothetical protein K6T16_00465 [Candidatus Pacearchaeota archaeon]|nr:hypothetical protein [Candidatus Pacearchaeota archaeon]